MLLVVTGIKIHSSISSEQCVTFKQGSNVCQSLTEFFILLMKLGSYDALLVRGLK